MSNPSGQPQAESLRGPASMRGPFSFPGRVLAVRYLITGGSGYIGSRLVERLAARDEVERILICDVRPPRVYRPGVAYRSLDVTDAAAVRAAVGEERPDVVVHLAFALKPIHVQGTR